MSISFLLLLILIAAYLFITWKTGRGVGVALGVVGLLLGYFLLRLHA